MKVTSKIEKSVLIDSWVMIMNNEWDNVIE
jgi:hypothetical protein